MKNVLFTTTALVAVSFSGMAFADDGIVWTGEAWAGYNDDQKNGGFLDAEFDFMFTKTTDQGITFGLGWGFDYDSGATDGVNFGNFPTFYASSSAGSVYIGDVDQFAGEEAVEGLPMFDFFDALDSFFYDEDGEFALDIEGNYNGWGFGISSIIGDGTGTTGGLGDPQVGLSSELGNFQFALGYEPAAFDDGVGGPSVNDILGLGIQTEISGFTIGLAYTENGDAANSTSTSIGVIYDLGNGFQIGGYYGTGDPNNIYGFTAAYEMDAFTAKLAYRNGGASNAFGGPGDESQDRFRLSGSYTWDVLTFEAGYSTEDAYAGTPGGLLDEGDGSYAGVSVDLGGDAEFIFSYAQGDEAWGPEYMQGTSAYLHVKF